MNGINDTTDAFFLMACMIKIAERIYMVGKTNTTIVSKILRNFQNI